MVFMHYMHTTLDAAVHVVCCFLLLPAPSFHYLVCYTEKLGVAWGGS